MAQAAEADCPSEDELAELVEHGLSAEDLGPIERHIARCATCRDALAAAVMRSGEGRTFRRSSSGTVEALTLAPGVLVGRYRIVALLGSGAMGSVYEATDPELDRRVAVKVLRRGASDANQDLGHRLRREARAMAKLSHPNVVTIFDVGADGGQVFIAMELLTGGTLRRWLAAEPRSWRAIVETFLLAGRGLAAAHSAGLVHRDFKPDNVLVTPAGDVRVTDFGLVLSDLEGAARSPATYAVERASVESRLTRTGMVLGTPAYMAPEQLDGVTADARSDVFSFCVALWEALHRQRPFEGLTLAELRDSIGRGRVAPERAPDVPTEVSAALVAGLADAPEARYPSMAPLLERLAATLVAGAPRPPGGRRRALLGTGGVALGVLALGLALRAGALHAESLSAERTPAAAALPVTIVDGPAPRSESREALAAFSDGMHAVHDGGWARARDAFTRALAADPMLAEAHLRLGITSSGSIGTVRQAQVELQRAAELRARLTERDQVLLDALEPMLQRTPPDRREATARLRKAIERFPDDAEFHLWLGDSLLDFDGLGDPAGALPAFARASTLDPAFTDAWEGQGRALAWLGRIDEARGVFEKCAAIPTAVDCLFWLKFVDAADGDCAACERDARRRIDRDPTGVVGHHNLADAFLAVGASPEAARVALAESTSQYSADKRAREGLFDQANLEIVLGDFALGRELAERQLAAIEDDPEGVYHFRPIRTLVQLALERGDRKAAGQLADGFLKRAGAWATTGRSFDKTADEVPWLLRISERDGTLSADDFETARAAWLNAVRTTSGSSGYLWVLAYAEAADTPEEARAALEELPRLGPLPPFFPSAGNAELAVGRVYALAGRAEEAKLHLERAAKHCARLNDPFAHPHAELELGLVDERLGDVAGACEAYRVVLTQWGGAKVESRTAASARDRSGALECPR